MASTSTSQAPVAPQMPPLKAWQRIGCKIGICVAAVLICVGIGGILVVSDKEQKMWLSKTQFGDLWRYLMSINAIFIPAVMNAGLLGTLLCGHNLQYDHRARFGDPRKDGPSKAPKKKTRAKKVD